MVRLNEVRRNELAVEAPKSFDAGLAFIGIIRTPWTSRLDCPRQGRGDGPICRIEVAEPWVAALDGSIGYTRRDAILCAKAQLMTAQRAAGFRCARRSGRTPSARRWSVWLSGGGRLSWSGV